MSAGGTWELIGSSLFFYALLGIGIMGASGAILMAAFAVLRLFRVPWGRVSTRQVRVAVLVVLCVVAAVFFWRVFLLPQPLFESSSPDGSRVLYVGETVPLWGAGDYTRLVLRLVEVETAATLLKTAHRTRALGLLAPVEGEGVEEVFPVEWGAVGRGVMYVPHEALAILLPGGIRLRYADLGADFDPLVRDYLAGTIDAASLQTTGEK